MSTTQTVTGAVTLLYGTQGSGNSTMLIVNLDAENTVWVNESAQVQYGGPVGVPVPPGSSISMTATQGLWAVCAPGTSVQIALIPNGTSYFLPASLSSLGGVKVFIQAGQPAITPGLPVGSLWLQTDAENVVTGWFYYPGGADWVPQTFNASDVLTAGTIIASLIAAGTVVAGIVDGTTIEGGTLIISQGSGATYEEVEINGATGAITWSKYQPTTVVIRQILGNGTDLTYADPGSGGSQGALIRADSPVDGTDQFGNDYFTGLTVGPATSPQVYLNPDGSDSGAANSEVEFPLPGAWPHYPNIYGSVSGTGGLLSVNGPVDSTQADQSFISMESASYGGNGAAYGFLTYKDKSGTIHNQAFWGVNGLTIPAGTVAAVKPGTGTSASNLAVAETWHTAALATGYTTNSADQAPRYMIDAQGFVHLDGVAYTSAAVAAGNPCFTLPSGYIPKIRKRFVGLTNFSGWAAGDTSVEIIGTTGTGTPGVVGCPVAASGSGQQLVLDGISFPVN